MDSQAVKLALVGMSGAEGALNECEVPCVLAQDVDLRARSIRARNNDTNVGSHAGTKKGLVVAGDGTVYSNGTTRFGFNWGAKAYFLEGANSWREHPSGNVLAAPTAPVIASIADGYTLYAWDAGGAWSPVPSATSATSYTWTWAAASTGELKVIFTPSSPPDWSQYNSVLFEFIDAVDVYTDSLTFILNNIECQISSVENRWVGRASDVQLTMVEFAVDHVARSSVASWGLRINKVGASGGSFNIRSNYSAPAFGVGNRLSLMGHLPSGIQTYVAVFESNGVPSLPSTPVAFNAKRHGNTALFSVTGGGAGQTLRIYRAIGGNYFEAAHWNGSTYSYGVAWAASPTAFKDIGNFDTAYKAGGSTLPAGPVAIWSDRVVVISSADPTNLYFSSKAEPLRFPAVPIDEETDGWLEVLPDSGTALDVIDGRLVVHCKTSVREVLGDRFSNRYLRVIDTPVAISSAQMNEPAKNGLVAGFEGLYLGTEPIFMATWDTTKPISVFRSNGVMAAANGTTLYVLFPTQVGWYKWVIASLSQINDMSWDGSYLMLAGAPVSGDGVKQIASAGTRVSAGIWECGELPWIPQSKANWLWALGTCVAKYVNQTGTSDGVTFTADDAEQLPNPGFAMHYRGRIRIEVNNTQEVKALFVEPRGGKGVK